MSKSEIMETVGCRKKISVEVEKERFDSELTSAMKKLKSRVQLPGFRKGKAPESLLLKRFGKVIREEAVNDLIPKILQEVFEEHGINHVGEPVISDLKFDEGSPVVFTVSVEEVPDIDISGFEGLKVTKEVQEVIEEDVDNSLERLCQMRAVRSEVDREVRKGDIIVTNLQKLDSSGVPIIGDKMEGHVIALNDRGTPSPEFDEQVMGMRKDDTRMVRFTYNESIENPDLIGKTEAYDVEIVQVVENKVPELNDEFAKSLERYKDVNDLREQTRDDLSKQSEYLAERKLQADLINEFVKDHPFEIPDSMVERIIQSELENYQRNNTDLSVDEEAFRNQIRPDAVRAVQTYLIVDKIKREKEIDVTKEEIAERINEIAEATGQEVKELRRTLIKEGRFESLENDIEQKKVYDWMIEVANIKEEIVKRKSEKIILMDE